MRHPAFTQQHHLDALALRRCIFQRSAVLNRRTSALLHLTSVAPNQPRWPSESHLSEEKQAGRACRRLDCQKTLDSRRYGVGISFHS
jgi:hypothetical protein